MSEKNGKVCANCRHCKRENLNGYTRVYCEIDGWALSYVKVMSGWCRHWAKEKANDYILHERNRKESKCNIL